MIFMVILFIAWIVCYGECACNVIVFDKNTLFFVKWLVKKLVDDFMYLLVIVL